MKENPVVAANFSLRATAALPGTQAKACGYGLVGKVIFR